MKNKFALLIAILLVICSTFSLTACDNLTTERQSKTNDNLTDCNEPIPEEHKTNEELYAAAVRDSMVIDDDEILPLVNISREDENVSWNGDKVLVSFIHKYPSSYPIGEDITLQWGNVWCVSATEMNNWVKANGQDVTDWSLRLHQLLGMPTSKGYTTVTALWVDADLLHRPANVTDTNSPMQKTYQPTGDEEFDSMYKAWFDDNIIWSYFESAYPWTRLGYTYDWADNGTKYGLSEFLIFSGASATVAYTYSLEDYITYVCSGLGTDMMIYAVNP